MLAYILNKCGKPLMPCLASKAKNLLKIGKAKVIKRVPFTIRLLHGSSGYKQSITAGMDSGSKNMGCCALSNNAVLYQSEILLREDVSKKMLQRATYRRTRRNRKTRYRKPRWQNRSSMCTIGRLAPSMHSKIGSHIRERNFVESILPITHWKVETASFDIHKIVKPEVSGKDYQEGNKKNFYNFKAYVLSRDAHTCQSKYKGQHSSKLHVHHIIFRSNGGTDDPSNLITLCETCHDALHRGEFELQGRPSKTKHATELGILKSTLSRIWEFEQAFGYETKFKREQELKLPKTHYFDALAICYDGKQVTPLDTIYQKSHIAKGDYQQRTGKRSEKIIPTGKLFGLRKFDLIHTDKGVGFVKGKRSSGYFALMDIGRQTISSSVNVKKNTHRISARTTTLIQLMEAALPLGTEVPSFRAENG